MNKITFLDLPLENGRNFYYKQNLLESITCELEEFLSIDENMNNLHFAKKMMFSNELQANNQVEGYGDDLAIIEKVIKMKSDDIKDEENKRRIINLYRGYQYILKNKKIDKQHLSELYQILSKDLLNENDYNRMGKYYREGKVFILKNGRIDTDLEEAVDIENIEYLMDKYFAFFNEKFIDSQITNEYIKSQILHFYLVYIHPYFDVNGRTSRTMSMWHLLNTKAYPYIIFNRGISFSGSQYDFMIRKTKSNCDLTSFLLLMLETVKKELEKEYVMQSIANNCQYKLNSGNYQTLLYFLTLNGVKSTKDFATNYNNLNDYKKVEEIYEQMILPLIDMNILEVKRYSKSNINGTIPNMILDLNKSMIDTDHQKIRRLKL